ncbi:MAG: LysR family transcriptional regulator [Planctomycetia bacterium]|nr:LysR family transcriptional regulator [Planctomycetia bacterium]
MSRIYYKGVQLEQIRSFCRVARLGSFVAVAAELGLSAPTVWRQVRALERECKAPLLVRRGRSVHLTHEGQLALELLEPHLVGIDSVRDLLHEQLSEAPRQLTVASTSMLLAEFLGEPLQEFVAAEPKVMLSLLNEPADQSLRHVLAGEADVGIVTYLPEEALDPQLVVEDLLELPWLLTAVEGHPLSKKRNLKLADLLAWPWIMPARETQPRRHVEEMLRQQGVREQIRVVLESRSFSLTQTYVALGLGISLWYGGNPRKPAPGLWLRNVSQWFGITPVAIVTRKGAHLPAHVQAFLRIVRRQLGQK